MNEILVNDFNGRCISTFFWKDKVCFLPFEITNVLGYADGTKTIQDCIKKEVFEEGEDYFVLKGIELKEFKNNCTNALLKSLKKVARLLILTEMGLYGFLQYSHKRGALGFKKWVRGKVLPSIREKGYYSISKWEQFLPQKTPGTDNLFLTFIQLNGLIDIDTKFQREA